jgi:hypothetical protein
VLSCIELLQVTPAVSQPEELSWSGTAAPPYPSTLIGSQDSDSDDSSAGSSDSYVANDVADDLADLHAVCSSSNMITLLHCIQNAIQDADLYMLCLDVAINYGVTPSLLLSESQS